MATALIGLGSNLGDRAAALGKAIELLRGDSQIRVEAVSSFRQSKPAGGPAGQGEFINACAQLETSLAPEALLARLLAIEVQVGRVREERWGPRVIDLDLLLYDRVEMKTSTLELPHPRMCYRRFVLEPAAEIAGEMVWPVNGWSVAELASNLNDSPQFLSLFDPIGVAGCNRILAAIKRQKDIRTLNKADMLRAMPQIHELAPNVNVENWLSEFFDEVFRASNKTVESLRTPGSTWTVCDGWLNDFIELSPLPWLKDSPDKRESLLSSARKLVVTTPRPRLLVVVEVDFWRFQFGSNEKSAHAAWASGSSSSKDIQALLDSWEEFWCRVRNLLSNPESPPSYWLSEGEESIIVTEVLAAMQAME